MSVIHWTEIEAFYNVLKTVRKYPELLRGKTQVEYRGKVKLHGSNAGVQIFNDGRVVAQSRTTELSVTNDYAGFAKWVSDSEELWKKVQFCVCCNPEACDACPPCNGCESKGLVVFGEWCGPGIQKGVAISQIPKRIFAVFAIRVMDDDLLIDDPVMISNMLKDIPDVYVLPWFESITLDYSKAKEDLEKDIEPINEWVNAIENEDPWVEKTFGVKGTGEGIVFYPSGIHTGVENFGNLSFKAKGQKHKVVKTKEAVQVDPESAASIAQFVEMVLPEPRLEQGVTKTSVDGTLVFDIKLTGMFVGWILADVEKETEDELEASNLTWKQVQKAVNDRARNWYVAKCKALR